MSERGQKYKLVSVDGAAPNWTSDGQPTCSKEECPAYDGKRCGLMGFRPALHCEPAVIAMADEVKRLRGTAGATPQEEPRGPVAVLEVTYCKHTGEALVGTAGAGKGETTP